MPTRVVTGSVGVIPGETMGSRRQHFISTMDDARRLLVNEPRGHAAMNDAILQPPVIRTPMWECCTSRFPGVFPYVDTEVWAWQRSWWKRA
ncbi:MAG TPA: proline racemase family protein [Candidatus Stackebrandtia excrementipullorum]|nr:proline racemase family protein [Candidatus Stackebrandtia excrementipullorum]